MKTFLTIFAFTFAFCVANAEDIKLKITYKGSGVSGHTVTVLIGDAALGSGVTDAGGNVTISVSSLPVKNINLKGEKKCDNAQKSWEANGYVTLDGNNSAELKMEELTKMMAEASGGFLTENALATSYGLVCGGSGSSSGTNSSDNGSTTGNNSNSNNTVNTANTVVADYKTREDNLASQKERLEFKLDNINRKIEKKTGKMNELNGEEKIDAKFDIRELEIEKKQTQNELDKVNLQIQKKILNKEERNQFKDKEDVLDAEMKALKEERKSKRGAVNEGNEEKKDEVVKEEKKEEAVKEEKKEEVLKEEIVTNTGSDTLNAASGKTVSDEDDLIYTEAEFAAMSKNDLGKKKLGLNTDLSKLKLKLKTRKNSMSPTEVSEAEARIAKIEAAIASIEKEQEKRKNE